LVCKPIFAVVYTNEKIGLQTNFCSCLHYISFPNKDLSVNLKKMKTVWIVLIVLGCLLAATGLGVGLYFAFRPSGSSVTPVPTPTSSLPITTTPTATSTVVPKELKEDYLYVLCAEDNLNLSQIVPFDIRSGTPVIKPAIPVFNAYFASGLALSEDAKTLWMLSDARPGLNPPRPAGMTAIDLTTDPPTVPSVVTVPLPFAIFMQLYGTYAFVVGGFATVPNHFYCVDLKTLQIVSDTVIPDPGFPYSQCFSFTLSPDGKNAYLITNRTDQTGSIVKLRKLINITSASPVIDSEITVATVSAFSRYSTITPDGVFVYASDESLNQVYKIQVSPGALGPVVTIPSVNSAGGITAAANGIVYVSNIGTNTITPISNTTPATPIPTNGTSPRDIVIKDVTDTAYVSNNGSASIVSIDLSTATPSAAIPTLQTLPKNMALGPVPGTL